MVFWWGHFGDAMLAGRGFHPLQLFELFVFLSATASLFIVTLAKIRIGSRRSDMPESVLRTSSASLPRIVFVLSRVSSR